MSRLRHNATGLGLRLRSINDAKRAGAPLVTGPGRDCTGTELGERLGIAALYAGRGDNANACSTALLACAGLPDTAANRALIGDALDPLLARIQQAVARHGGRH